jgi:hypothetical protein
MSGKIAKVYKLQLQALEVKISDYNVCIPASIFPKIARKLRRYIMLTLKISNFHQTFLELILLPRQTVAPSWNYTGKLDQQQDVGFERLVHEKVAGKSVFVGVNRAISAPSNNIHMHTKLRIIRKLIGNNVLVIFYIYVFSQC